MIRTFTLNEKPSGGRAHSTSKAVGLVLSLKPYFKKFPDFSSITAIFPFISSVKIQIYCLPHFKLSYQIKLKLHLHY